MDLRTFGFVLNKIGTKKSGLKFYQLKVDLIIIFQDVKKITSLIFGKSIEPASLMAFNNDASLCRK